MPPLCLLVSADADASAGWRRALAPFGFRLHAVPGAEAALGVLAQWRFDAVLVDGDAARGARPALDALGTLSVLRARTAAPILVVWSERGDAAQIEALDRGAAATVVRPASPRLVGATLKRLVELARAPAGEAAASEAPADVPVPPPAEAVVSYGPLRLDAGRALATCGGRPMPLTAGEFELVALLARRAGEVVTREAMVRSLASGAPGSTDGADPSGRDGRRSVDMHVCRIRRKLDAAGAVAHGVRLATVHGRGYAFRVAADG